jgi:hypothetical protein
MGLLARKELELPSECCDVLAKREYKVEPLLRQHKR